MNLDPDQRLLRVLLDDDQTQFEEAMADRLLEHRASAGTDPAPAHCSRSGPSPWPLMRRSRMDGS
ncbi:hypothetical protein ACFCV8_08005 [Streptomyces sp. NPDC056347]|uniref:hypothetical protein n=1 Tax=Streptomyces sp. NPDC056347 TaxID=3345790 RepID=UPI0035DCAAD3